MVNIQSPIKISVVSETANYFQESIKMLTNQFIGTKKFPKLSFRRRVR